MTMLKIGLVVIILQLAAYSEGNGYHMKVGVPKSQELLRIESLSRIIGGTQVASASVIPYQAGIIARLTNGYQSICGGSLISTTRVLTAAHCWFDGQSQAATFTIVLGSITIFTGGVRIETKDVVVHPNWNTNTVVNDIAMVKFPAVTLTTQASHPTTTALYRVSVTVISNAACQQSLGVNNVQLQVSHLCTSGTGKVGTCDGDSGGPLAATINRIETLVGVVSFGLDEGCEAGKPSVFTRVGSFLSWIQANL